MHLRDTRVFVAGHGGLVGAALVRRLITEGARVQTCSRSLCDLRRQGPTEDLLARCRPDIVFLAAATVGGIDANRRRPAEFIYDNLAIATNVIEASRRSGVKKFVFLGSSCIYPRDAVQPITEDALLTGPLEESNRAYAVAKIAGIELCRAYAAQHGFPAISVMPPNVYGESDHFIGADNHVMAALIARIVAAKRDGQTSITIWGTGKPVREFLHTDDLADALCFLSELDYSSPEPINVGPGFGTTIMDLARLIAYAAKWDGEIVTDPGMPDGHPSKVMDVSRVEALGWRPKIVLADGIRRVVAAYEASLPVPVRRHHEATVCVQDGLGTTYMWSDNVANVQ